MSVNNHVFSEENIQKAISYLKTKKGDKPDFLDFEGKW